MADAVHRPDRWTYDAWLALEATSTLRHELVDGELLATAGGSEAHALLALRVGALLDAALAGRPCFVFGSDLAVRVDEETVFYPDVQVICRERGAEGGPALVVEVLSDSTEVWDRSGKFERYRRLPSLQHYLLVAQHHERIEHFHRNGDGSWQYRSAGPGEQLRIGELAVVDVDAVYERARALRALIEETSA